ncbi:MAG TPA: glycosyltransferase family 39 protein, partial [Tepidisphaeraceae bacterium]
GWLRFDWLIVLLATLLLTGVAGHRLVDRAIWGDEVRTWRDSVNKPYGDILRWRHNADHAPLGHLATKISSDLLATQAPWALRLPALLFGAAVVPLAYLLGRLAVGRRAGVLMALMVCVDVTVTTQAHQARMYTQFLAWTLASLCCFAALMREDRRPAVFVALLGICLALSVWTHFSAVALLLAVAVTAGLLLIAPAHRAAGRRLLVAAAIAVALSGPGLLKLFGMRGREALPGAGESGTFSQIREAVDDLMGNEIIGIALFVLAMMGLHLLRRWHPRLAVLMAVSVLIGMVSLFVAAGYRQIEGQRYLLGFLPACWLGLAVLNDHMLGHPKRWVARTFAALFAAGVLFQAVRTAHAQTHPMADAMRRAAATLPWLGYAPGSALIFAPYEPIQMAGKYYGLNDDRPLHRRIDAAIVARAVTTPATVGRARPDALWMLVVAPCRKISETDTPLDGPAAACVAAGYFGHTLDLSRFPHDTDIRELSIVHLTPDHAKIWTADGTPR